MLGELANRGRKLASDNAEKLKKVADGENIHIMCSLFPKIALFRLGENLLFTMVPLNFDKVGPDSSSRITIDDCQIVQYWMAPLLNIVWA